MIQILTGTALLLAVLALFTLFSYKAPHGMKAMGALANAACASFLVEAFHASLFGTQMGITFLQGVGDASGSLGFWLRNTSRIYSWILSIFRC